MHSGGVTALMRLIHVSGGETATDLYIYIYIYVCVCVCERWGDRCCWQLFVVSAKSVDSCGKSTNLILMTLAPTCVSIICA